MKNEIVVIQSKNGDHKSSILRTMSQVLISHGHENDYKFSEGIVTDCKCSILTLGNNSIGVIEECETIDSVLDSLKELKREGCRLILCAIQYNQDYVKVINEYAIENQFDFTNMVSHWSEKMEVNYLSEKQVGDILQILETPILQS